MQTIRQTIITNEEVRAEIRVMVDLPAEIEREQRAYNVMSGEVTKVAMLVGDAKQELQEARGTISFLVEHETVNNGTEEKPKMKPAFSNQAARDLETDKRCKDDPVYQSALARLRKAEGDLFAKKAVLEDQAATIKRLAQSLSIRQSILNAVAGLAQEQIHSDELKLIAKFKAVMAEISGGNNEDER